MDIQLYPTIPFLRARAIARDVFAVVLLLLCAWLGHFVHDTIAELNVLSRGVQQAGTSIQDGFGSAGDRVDHLPVVGNEVSDALTDAGDSSGGKVRRVGERGEERVEHVATTMGWIIGGLAALYVLSRVAWPRVGQVRALTAARRVLRGTGTEGHAGTDVEAARRAAYSLPFGTLLRYTADPLGDLAAGRHDALVRCLCEDAGLRVPVRARRLPA